MNLENLQTVLLTAACRRCVSDALDTLVEGLVREPGVALARIWLRRPGDICDRCPLREECPDRRECLHLVASAGGSIVTDESWSRLDGSFGRFPVGVRKIGVIAASGESSLITDVSAAQEWIARPDWAEAEGIRSFAGQPLVEEGETIGVLAIFSREPLGEADLRWLRVFADHAASAIANARAYEEIDRLRAQLERENEYLRQEVARAVRFGDIIGRSEALHKTLEQVELVAPTEANVLIHGETGTGKELLARSIHERSRRGHRPMIKVNCASVPKELFESEFFGHVRGSFTGAIADREGRFELAEGGTLFLDEVGEIPVELQSKLLRVLQEGEFERVGDARSRKVDVRVISATNRDLPEEIEAGRFRQDLYYRLSVFPIEVPPLRDRIEDVEPLALHFVRSAGAKHGLPSIRLEREDVRLLEAYDWPGNVRELQHVIERAAILSRGGPPDFRAVLGPMSGGGRRTGDDEVVPMAELKRLERRSIRAALERSRGKVYGAGGAAEMLGMKPTTLLSRMKSLEIEKS